MHQTYYHFQAVYEVNEPEERFDCGSYLRTVQAAMWLANVTEQGWHIMA